MDIEATMTLTAVSTEKPDTAANIPALLERLQVEQFHHDETYHREIARLGMQDRLRHMALHFAKYAGNLAENRADETHVKRIATDVFIIGMSSANTLNIWLAEALAARIHEQGDLDHFAMSLTTGAGRMAAACEKLDHLEDFPFRQVIRDSVLDLIESAISFTASRGWDLGEMVRTRLKPVKEKSVLHGRL